MVRADDERVARRVSEVLRERCALVDVVPEEATTSVRPRCALGEDKGEDEHSAMRRVADGLVLETGEEAATDEVVDEPVSRTQGRGDDAGESEEGTCGEH